MEYLFCLERKSVLKFNLCVLSWQPKLFDSPWLVDDNIPLLLPYTWRSSSAHTGEDWHKLFLIELQMLSKDGVIILTSPKGKICSCKKKKKCIINTASRIMPSVGLHR